VSVPTRKRRSVARRTPRVRDLHRLYSAAVQSPETDLAFFQRIYRRVHGQRFTRLREDFCGTALLACEFVRQRSTHRAWGIDLDRPTLDWGIRHYVPVLGAGASRLELLCRDVLRRNNPRAEVIAALNFSYCVFGTREQLRRYFERVRASLEPGGVFFIDIFGGTEAIEAATEERRIPAERTFDGARVPAFTYVWEQARFNPVDHRILCKIHFKLHDGSRIRDAFVYDWRLWTLPELQELMLEAGFRESEVYVEGWDDEANDTNGIFRRRRRFENQSGWVAYVVGLT